MVPVRTGLLESVIHVGHQNRIIRAIVIRREEPDHCFGIGVPDARQAILDCGSRPAIGWLDQAAFRRYRIRLIL